MVVVVVVAVAVVFFVRKLLVVVEIDIIIRAKNPRQQLAIR